MNITALITTFNSAETLEKALNSVDWCDEILVVDSYSTDNTLEIAQKYTVSIVQHEYLGSSRQLEFGTTLAKNEYVLILDSDEEISPELKAEIRGIIESGNFNAGGYRISRQIYFLGKWIKHGGWSDVQFRLFKKSNVKFNHRHDAHWSTECPFPAVELKSVMYHYTYRNIYDFIGRLNIYSSLDVKTKYDEKKDLKVKWYNLILNPWAEFLKMFFLNGGYKDGMQGFILATFSAVHKLSAYAKMWEYEHSKKQGLEMPPVTYNDFKKNKKN